MWFCVSLFIPVPLFAQVVNEEDVAIVATNLGSQGDE
jgi:hypothetical protein